MITQTVTCDRCKDEIPGGKVPFVFFVQTSPNTTDTFDICQQCEDSFRVWMDNIPMIARDAKKTPPPVSMQLPPLPPLPSIQLPPLPPPPPPPPPSPQPPSPQPPYISEQDVALSSDAVKALIGYSSPVTDVT